MMELTSNPLSHASRIPDPSTGNTSEPISTIIIPKGESVVPPSSVITHALIICQLWRVNQSSVHIKNLSTVNVISGYICCVLS